MFGEIIKKARLRKNLSRTDLADKIKVASRHIIRAWEKDITVPHRKNMLQLEKILDIEFCAIIKKK